MKHILFLVAIAFSLSAKAQFKFVELNQVKDHAGDTVVTIGKVFSTRYLADAKNSPTFLNVGGDFPNQLLTIVIWGSDRKNFDKPVEEYYKGKMLRITGKVEMYKGKPQIVVKDYGAFEELTIKEEPVKN